MNSPAPPRGMRIFTLIWAGQLVSLLGSGLSGFALGLWVLRGTGSVTRFALISMFTVLPRILLAPVAGALTDRWDRRRTMIASESVSAVATLALASLLYSGHLQIWQIYVAISLISTSSAFQWPAYTAAATVLVPKDKLGQASGMVQSAQGVAQTCAPMLAGFLIEMPWVQVGGVLAIDALSYLFALGTLLAVHFPSLRSESTKENTGNLFQEIGYGRRYLLARPGLLGLLFFLAASNFVFGLITVLVAPLVLSFASPKVLGTVMTSAGMGMMIGSIAMAAWGGPKRRVPAILGFTVLSGIALLPACIPQSATVIAVGAFFFLLGNPLHQRMQPGDHAVQSCSPRSGTHICDHRRNRCVCHAARVSGRRTSRRSYIRAGSRPRWTAGRHDRKIHRSRPRTGYRAGVHDAWRPAAADRSSGSGLRTLSQRGIRASGCHRRGARTGNLRGCPGCLKLIRQKSCAV